MALLISDIGPAPNTFVGATPQRSGSGRILCLALAADGQRMYAGSYAGVWRSDDAGRSFTQMSRPQPSSFEADVPGALQAPHIFDIAVSPGDPDIVLAAAVRSQFISAPNGVWRSADGGQSWTLVQPAFSVGQIAFAPDDPSLVIAPIGNSVAISHDAGLNWSVRFLSPAWHVAIGPLEGSGVRRVYVAGNNVIWYSVDGGATWRPDSGVNVVVTSRAATSAFIVANGGGAIPAFGGGTTDVGGAGPQALAIEPGNPQRIYLAARGGTFGLSYFARDKNNNPIPDGTEANVTPIRLAGEGSLWTADFSGFEANGAAQWESVPGPPLYSGATTPSGLVFVQCRPISSEYLIFFADQSSVYVAVGRPLNSIQWHRLDGRDASFDKRVGELFDHTLVHVDPHALVTSADFDLTLKPVVDVPSPYNQNSELDQYLGGVIWMANDGGVRVERGWRRELESRCGVAYTRSHQYRRPRRCGRGAGALYRNGRQRQFLLYRRRRHLAQWRVRSRRCRRMVRRHRARRLGVAVCTARPWHRRGAWWPLPGCQQQRQLESRSTAGE